MTYWWYHKVINNYVIYFFATFLAISMLTQKGNFHFPMSSTYGSQLHWSASHECYFPLMKIWITVTISKFCNQWQINKAATTKIKRETKDLINCQFKSFRYFFLSLILFHLFLVLLLPSKMYSIRTNQEEVRLFFQVLYFNSSFTHLRPMLP